MLNWSIHNWMGLALSGLMLATLPACSAMAPVASAGNAVPNRAKKAALLTTSAQAAIQRADGAAAVRDAEAAVALTPDQAKTRALLGRAYLTAGRFESANSAFGDALTLDPTMARIAVTRALTQIALGDKAAALASLEQARGQGDEAEIGLALALAGEKGQAIARLEAAARAPGATARARQNLALAYALQGRWDDAQATAAVDLPAEQMAGRMQRWSQLAQRGSQPAVQVAMLLGVLPTADAGQPQTLALAKPAAAPAPVEMALAEAVPVPAAPVAVEAIPMTPVVVAPAANVAAPVAIVADPSTEQLAMTPAAPDERIIAAPQVPFVLAAAASPNDAPKAPLMMLATVPAKPTPRPIIPVVQRPAVIRLAGKFVVQLGAFSSAHRTEAAWTRINGKARYLSNFTPVGSGFRQGKATLYRLSISGLDTRAQADRLCRRIKASGGVCFVRGQANDRPMRWTTRGRDGEAA